MTTTNQIKVLLQRVYNGGRKAKAILVSAPLRDALRAENPPTYLRNTFPKDDLFAGVPVKLVKGITAALIELEPETSGKETGSGLILPNGK